MLTMLLPSSVCFDDMWPAICFRNSRVAHSTKKVGQPCFEMLYTILKCNFVDEPTTSSVSAYWNDDANEFTASIETESDILTIEVSIAVMQLTLQTYSSV